MKPWLPIGHTRRALAVTGFLATSGLAALGAAMFAFPAVLRPVLPILIGGIASRAGARSPYSADDYYLWAWGCFVCALACGLLFLLEFIRRQAADRRIDAALRHRREHSVRGAPTEPG